METARPRAVDSSILLMIMLRLLILPQRIDTPVKIRSKIKT
jgi:hypothetical protein